LLLLTNLTLVRRFGPPALGWRGLLSIETWRQMMKEDTNTVGVPKMDCEELLSVKGLSKVYHGQKNVQF
jgi:hypothetical protein